MAAEKTKLAGIATGATANTGTVTSVGVAVPTGFSVTAAITTSGTITISYAAGYQGFTTVQSNKLAGIPADADKTPALATVATSGSYNDLTNKPVIPAAQVQADWNAISGIAAILNKPVLGTAAAQNVGAFATADQGLRADTAVQPDAMNTALAAKLGKTEQAADSAKLEGKTAAQLPISSAVQVALDGKAGVYTGSAATEVNFPIGHMLTANKTNTTAVPVNSTVVVRLGGGDEYAQTGSGMPLTGVWACRGVTHLMASSYNRWHLFQRIA